LLNKFPTIKGRFDRADEIERAIQRIFKDVIDHIRKYKASNKADEAGAGSVEDDTERKDGEEDEMDEEKD
jgi:hypothetical protein